MNIYNVIKKSILMILPASDFNEEEFLTVKNNLEKAGFKIFIASDAIGLCSGSKGLKVKADVSLYNMNDRNFIAIVLIGGKGSRNYWDNTNIHSILHRFNNNRKLVSAICSAPVTLARAGLLNDKEAVCYQDDKRTLEREGVTFRDAPLVSTGNIITGSGPKEADDFASAIINYLKK